MKMIVSPSLNLAAVNRTTELSGIPKDALVVVGQARHALQDWNRHFAGHTRATCDAWWLREHLARLHTLYWEMGRWPLEAQRQALASQLVAMGQEEGRIQHAQLHGQPDQVAGALQQRLRTQVELVRLHLTGRAHAAVRPALVRRIQGALDELQREMRGTPAEAKWGATVAEQLEAIGPVREAVEAIWMRTAPADRVLALGLEVSGAMHTTGPDRWDRLAELEVQLGELDRIGPHLVVRSMLEMVQNAMDEIERQRQTPSEDLF